MTTETLQELKGKSVKFINRYANEEMVIDGTITSIRIMRTGKIEIVCESKSTTKWQKRTDGK